MPGITINNIKTENFLSFEDCELKNLNRNINFIVGPNGSGKTNLARLFKFIRETVGNSTSFPAFDIDKYLKKESYRMIIELEVELTLNDEEFDFVSIITAIILRKSLIQIENTKIDVINRSFSQIIESCRKLWQTLENGKIIMEFDRVTSVNKIIYKPISSSNLLIDVYRNKLLTGKPDDKRNLNGDDITEDNIKEIIESFYKDTILSFSLSLELGVFNIGSLNNINDKNFNNKKISKTEQFVNYNLKLPHFSEIKISHIFSWIFQNSIINLDNFRCPFSEKRTIEDIESAINFDNKNLFEYLFRMKIYKYTSYLKVLKAFEDLSGGRHFDIRIDGPIDTNPKRETLSQPILPQMDAIISNKPSFDISVNAHEFKLNVFIKEKEDAKDEYPLELSPAGYYELLAISAVIAEPQNKIVILDEPAQNLHPTFQHKLLRKIEEYTNDNQFFIITHSPELVEVGGEGYGCVFIFRKEGKNTNIYKFEPDEAIKGKFLKQEELKRLFFCKGAILAEGFSEEIFLNRLLRNKDFLIKIGEGEINELDLEVVNIEGVTSLPSFFRLMKELDIPYNAIIDSDIFDGCGKKNKEDNAKTVLKNMGYQEPYNDFTGAVEELKKSDTFFQCPNFEGYIKKEFLGLDNSFEDEYKLWCQERFGDFQENKKIYYPLFLTENKISEIISGKMSIYHDVLKDIIKKIQI